jgi:hypothetical protein
MKYDSNHYRVTTLEEISRWLARYRASGLGLQRFAQEHRIPAGRLHYWLYQKRRSKPAQRRVQAPVFQELKLAACPPPASRWAAEVSLPTGLAVRFDGAVSPAWIGSVVQALRQPC